jgi:hypothetical protein
MVVLAAAPPAVAQGTTSCQGSIAGEPAADHRTTDEALPVASDATVQVSGQAPGSTGQRYLVELELLGRRWSVAKGDVTQDGWTGTVKVKDYSGLSVGLFKVIGSTRDRSTDAVLCQDFMYVEVDGNPLTTVAGIGGAAALGGGLALIASAGAQARRAPFAPGLAGTEAGAAAISPRGVTGGVLSGLGAAVEVQQFAVALLTPGLLLGCVAGGLALGVVVPLAMARPAAAPGPLADPAPAPWSPSTWGTHVAPPGGLATWPSPDPEAVPGETIAEGLPVQVTERQGDWARVECSNGWSAWVDGRLLP